MFEKEAKERARDFTENKERQVAYECGFLDGADRMKEEMQKLEEDKCELLGIIQGKDKAIKELEEKISVLLSCKNCPENKGGYICQKEYEDKCLAQKIQYIKVMSDNYSKMEQKFYDNLSKAKVIIKDLMNNSDEYARQRAIDFLKEGEMQKLKEDNADLKQSLDWANEREKELKAQIEKMKCCENCKHHYWSYEELACRLHKIDVDTCNSWEMKND